MGLAEAAAFGASLLLVLGKALALTLVIELAVAAGAFGLRRRRELAVLALANVATNPALNLLLALSMAVTGHTSLYEPRVAAVLMVLELAVVVVEWRLIGWALPEHRPRAFAISLTMNAASLAFGLLIAHRF